MAAASSTAEPRTTAYREPPGWLAVAGLGMLSGTSTYPLDGGGRTTPPDDRPLH